MTKYSVFRYQQEVLYFIGAWRLWIAEPGAPKTARLHRKLGRTYLACSYHVKTYNEIKFVF